jgi:hypothetical protein
MGYRNRSIKSLLAELEPTPKTECQEICDAIAPFFTAAKWDAWCDAGPDNNLAFTEYAKAEWYKIAAEFIDCHPLPDVGDKPAWMIEAEAQAADYNDLKATQENART